MVSIKINCDFWVPWNISDWYLILWPKLLFILRKHTKSSKKKGLGVQYLLNQHSYCIISQCHKKSTVRTKAYGTVRKQIKIFKGAQFYFFQLILKVWEILVSQESSYFFSWPVSNLTAKICSVWKIMMKTCLVMVTIIKLTQ